MPIEKYRSAADMPAVARVIDPEERLPRLAALWEAAQLLGGGAAPRGVFRYRSVEEADSARDELVRERLRARRTASE